MNEPIKRGDKLRIRKDLKLVQSAHGESKVVQGEEVTVSLTGRTCLIYLEEKREAYNIHDFEKVETP